MEKTALKDEKRETLNCYGRNFLLCPLVSSLKKKHIVFNFIGKMKKLQNAGEKNFYAISISHYFKTEQNNEEKYIAKN